MNTSWQAIILFAKRVAMAFFLAWTALDSNRANAQVATTTLAGFVLTEDGAPLGDVQLSVVGSELAVQSDPTGRFQFPNVPLGQVRLRARAVGFVAKDTLVVLETGRTYSLRLHLRRFVPELDTVQVSAALPFGKPAMYMQTGKFDDFYERRARRPGTYFTREDVERSGRSRVSDLMSSVPGVTIQDRNGQAHLRVARCSATSVPTNYKKEDTRYAWFALYIDGNRIRAEPVEKLAQLSTSEIETMEVYRGVSQLPMEAVGDACAAVFITTRYSPGSVLNSGNR